MEVKLGENIRALRKKKGLTQEQLAEALNMSVGVISKWENAISTPELTVILALAGFFETSVDVLLGYQMQDQTRAQLMAQLKGYIRDWSAVVPWEAIERALLKYPHDFDVIQRCARLYEVRGIVGKDHRLLDRALMLMEDAVRLIDQNTDETISLASIQHDRAVICLSLGRAEEALAILKAENPCGIHDALIGNTLASICNRMEEAVPYLSGAMQKCAVTQSQMALGYLNVYMKQRRYQEAMEVVEWILAIIEAYRQPGKNNHMDKEAAFYLACKGHALLILNRREEACAALTEARQVALRFDADPSYAADRLRFVLPDEATVYDDFGTTALKSIDGFVAEENDAALSALWDEVRKG